MFIHNSLTGTILGPAPPANQVLYCGWRGEAFFFILFSFISLKPLAFLMGLQILWWLLSLDNKTGMLWGMGPSVWHFCNSLDTITSYIIYICIAVMGIYIILCVFFFSLFFLGKPSFLASTHEGMWEGSIVQIRTCPLLTYRS